MLRRNVNIKKEYVMLFVMVNFLIVGLYYTYGIFVVKQLKDDVSSISINSSVVFIKSNDLVNDSIKVAANSEKSIDIDITNISIVKQYYRILHTKVDTGVAVYKTSGDQVGEILGSETKKITVVIQNNTDKDVDVSFKCQESSVEYFDKIMNYSYINDSLNYDHSGATNPKDYLPSNMIAVYYEATSNTEGIWRIADVNNQDKDNIWYDYDNYRWANAVTIIPERREELLKSAPGTEIAMSDINAFFVYIPEYKYYIVSANGETSLEKPINVIFKGDKYTNLKGTVSCVDSISNNVDKHLYSEICNDTTYGNIYNNLSTYHHPSLSKEGMWVSKFASSYSSSATIRPDVSLSTSSNISTGNIRKMTGENNPYGFANTSNFNDKTWLYDNMKGYQTKAIDSMEWGAILILTNSPYGKSTNSMYLNDTIKSWSRVYSNASNYFTGRSTNYTTSSTSINVSSLKDVYYNDLTVVTHKTNAIEYPIGYKGAGASTTGTIYGIYDMAGGQAKTVMGIFMNEDGTSPLTVDDSFYTKYSYVPYSGEITNSELANYLQVFKLGDGVLEHVRNYSLNGQWQNGNITLNNKGIMQRGGTFNKNGSIFTVNVTEDQDVYATFVVLKQY